jgi:hypothetical protein
MQKAINKNVLRDMYGAQGGGSNKLLGENYTMKSFMVCTPHPLLLG